MRVFKLVHVPRRWNVIYSPQSHVSDCLMCMIGVCPSSSASRAQRSLCKISSLLALLSFDSILGLVRASSSVVQVETTWVHCNCGEAPRDDCIWRNFDIKRCISMIDSRMLNGCSVRSHHCAYHCHWTCPSRKQRKVMSLGNLNFHIPALRITDSPQ